MERYNFLSGRFAQLAPVDMGQEILGRGDEITQILRDKAAHSRLEEAKRINLYQTSGKSTCASTVMRLLGGSTYHVKK